GGRELVGGDEHGGAGHAVLRAPRDRGGAVGLELAADIAVGDQAGDRSTGAAVGLDHGGDAEAFAGHFIDDFGEEGFGRDAGQGIAGMHELADRGEALAELAAGMQLGEIARGEAALLGDGHGERVAQGEGGGGRGGGREAERAGFGRDADIEVELGIAGEERLGHAGEGDHGDADALERVELRVAAILRATMPLLPMPVMTTRPEQAITSWTARSNSTPTRAESACTAAASTSITRRAVARMDLESAMASATHRKASHDSWDGDGSAPRSLSWALRC